MREEIDRQILTVDAHVHTCRCTDMHTHMQAHVHTHTQHYTGHCTGNKSPAATN